MNWQKYYPQHPSIEECYKVMIKLRDYLHKNGFEYKVFDSERLNPETGLAFIRSMCEFGDLPFHEDMINTERSDSLPDHWWLVPAIRDGQIVQIRFLIFKPIQHEKRLY